MFVLRLVIPTPTPRNLPKGFLRPAVGVGYTIAAVAVNHPSLLSLGRVSAPGVTLGTKQAWTQQVLFPVVGWIEGWEKLRNESGGQAPQHGSSPTPAGKARSSSYGVFA